MPAHKKLQTRMEQMRKFRHQHEQLRTVILRVLRPVPASLINGQEVAGQDKVVDDAPNISAVEVSIKPTYLTNLCSFLLYLRVIIYYLFMI